jgi:hypothetical protein
MYEPNPVGTGNPQWVLGYQYFGGVTNWHNPQGDFAGHSPVKLGEARAFWVLAADGVMKIGTPPQWGGQDPDPTRAFVYANLPQHRKTGLIPAGGNEVFADGSAGWRKFETMYYLTTWDDAKASFIAQDTSDFDLLLAIRLPSLKAINWLTP